MSQALFQIWILSFLLYRVDVVGTLSVDNLMVPFLVLAWIFLGDRGAVEVKRRRFQSILIVTAVFSSLVIIDLLKIKGGTSIANLWYPASIHFRHYCYILVPLLYISNVRSLEWTIKSLLVVTVINCGLAFLGALGLAPSFIIAEESTRIPGLLRARGPIINLGDSALLISFTGLLVWTSSRQSLMLVGRHGLAKIVLLLVLFAGILASQSRNVILSVGMVIVVYYWLRAFFSGQRNTLRILVSIFAIMVFMGVLTFVVFNMNTIIAWITSMFGVSGEGTVRDRLGSYAYAIELLGMSPLLGLPPDAMVQHSTFIAGLHNMWLGMSLLSGVIGVMLILLLIMIGLHGALQLARSEDWCEYGVVCLSFILAALLVAPNFYPGHTAFVFWFFLGISLTTLQVLKFPAGDKQLRGRTKTVATERPDQQYVENSRILKRKSGLAQ